MTADELKRILADDAEWVVPCAKCGERPDYYFHVPVADCPRKGGCLYPEDHHEYVAATRGSTAEAQACFDRRALIAAYANVVSREIPS